MLKRFGFVIVFLASIFVLDSQAQDVAVSLDESSSIVGIMVEDHEVARFLASPDHWELDFNAVTSKIPGNVAIDALDYGRGGRLFFSLDCDTYLEGAFFADEDVILWDKSSFALVFDGDRSGLPRWADLDALDFVTTDPLEIILSLDIDARLTVGGETVLLAGEDLVRFRAGEGFTDIPFDGSLEGVPAGSDLDAFSRYSPNRWILSLDCAGRIGSLEFDDGDLVEWNPSSSSFSTVLFFDGLKNHIPLFCELNAAETNPWDLLFAPAILWMAY